MGSKITIAALSFSLLGAAHAAAAELSDAVSAHLGRIYALTKMCPNLEVNNEMLIQALKSVNMTASGAGETIAAQEAISETIAHFQGKDREYICVAALMLYGKEGTGFPGLLEERKK